MSAKSSVLCFEVKRCLSGQNLLPPPIQTISYHIVNILKEKELLTTSVVKEFLTTAADGKNYNVVFYSLEVREFIFPLFSFSPFILSLCSEP